jgi:alanine-synthesizing transaminase
MSKSIVKKAHKLDNVCYDIRGPVLQTANQMEAAGQRVYKFNIGNPAHFGFEAPDEIIQDVVRNLQKAQGYSDSRGIFSARKAVMQTRQLDGLLDTEIDDVFMGNGVSELIGITTLALLNDGDEVLIPSPDYPLWTAAVTLAGGKPVHYLCNEADDWQPSIKDIESKITTKTRAIVIINPNNPTGAVYSKQNLEQLTQIAEKHKLVVFADEIYDRILYHDAVHIPMASLVKNTLCITFNGLSKSYRLAGFRSGWMVLSGDKEGAQDYIEGLDIMTSMRLCANVPGQYAVQTSLGGYQSINDLVLPTGRLYEQIEYAYQRVTSIEGITCVKPKGAIYLFPKLDPERYPIKNDQDFILKFLQAQHCLLVQGTGFNLPTTDHVRIVTLAHKEKMDILFDRLETFLKANF